MRAVDQIEDPRFVAAVELIGRTGATSFQVRWCEEEEPTVWFAMAEWHGVWEAAAAMHPTTAVYRLCDQVIDGGTCTHCHRPTGFAAELGDMPLPEHVCWYQWDPELATFPPELRMKLTLTFSEPPPIPVFCAVLDGMSRRFPHAQLLMDKSEGLSWVVELGELADGPTYDDYLQWQQASGT